MSRRRLSRRGQSLVEFAAIVPLLLFAVMGIYSVSQLISAQDATTVASRNGARLASELGGNGWVTGSLFTDPTIADQKIVATAVAGVKAPAVPPGVTVVEIDVYRPSTDATQPAGYFNTTDPLMLIDRYNPDGTPYPGWTQQYTLDQRHDVLGNEALIAVRVVYSYQSPVQLFGWLSGQRTAYTVMQIQPR